MQALAYLQSYTDWINICGNKNTLYDLLTVSKEPFFQPVVGALFFHEFFVSAFLYHRPIVDHYNLICSLNGLQPVSNH